MIDYLANFPTFKLLILPTQKVNRLRQQRTRKDSNKHTISFIVLTLRNRLLVIFTLNK